MSRRVLAFYVLVIISIAAALLGTQLVRQKASLERERAALAEENAALAQQNLNMEAELELLRDFRGLSRPAGFAMVGGVPVGHPKLRGPDAHDGCVVPRLESGICPNASTRSGPVPEMRIAQQLMAARSAAAPHAAKKGSRGVQALVERAGPP